MLWGRSPERLASIADDLKVRSQQTVKTKAFDFNELNMHQEAWDEALRELGQIDLAIICYGTLGDQSACQQNFGEALAEFNSNCISTLSFLTLLGNYFEQRRAGCIVVVTSVAGDRGRQSNYVYGAAKSAVSTFLQGLRNRLRSANVPVITVKPGFVDTPMTAQMPKNPLFATPDKVAGDIVRAICRGANVVYTPWFWRYIMAAIKSVPEPIFNRLKL
jgi:decaprenylphospho-beta-D-erythro-pentofuranosid-2-ulose 2-reductase